VFLVPLYVVLLPNFASADSKSAIYDTFVAKIAQFIEKNIDIAIINETNFFITKSPKYPSYKYSGQRPLYLYLIICSCYCLFLFARNSSYCFCASSIILSMPAALSLAAYSFIIGSGSIEPIITCLRYSLLTV